MGCRGIHFALSDAEVDYLQSLPGEQDRLDYITEDLEETYYAEHEELLAETDKAWDAIHRALTDGQLNWDGGVYPLNHVILGGEPLYMAQDYIMSLKSPQQVRDIAAALRAIDEAEFRRRYFAINAADYGSPVDEQDFAYTWEWFQNVPRLYEKAADMKRHVLFTADQ